MQQKQSWQTLPNTVILGMLSTSHLYVYPIKSLGGIELYSARLTDRGIEHDRRWMLVGDDNRFLTQREFPQMALLRTAIHANELTVYEKGNEADKISLTLYPTSSELTAVQIWDDVCDAIEISGEANEWFSKKLNMSCKLMYMPDVSKRRVDAGYALNMEITGFADAYPLLMIGQASLDDFLRASDLMGVQRHLKVIGIFARICHRDGKPKYLGDVPRFFAYIHEVLARRPELAELGELLASLPQAADVPA